MSKKLDADVLNKTWTLDQQLNETSEGNHVTSSNKLVTKLPPKGLPKSLLLANDLKNSIQQIYSALFTISNEFKMHFNKFEFLEESFESLFQEDLKEIECK